MADPNYFWDSCVFSAYLCDQAEQYDIPSLEQYLDEAKAGKCSIYSSSLAMVEVLPSKMVKAEDFNAFVEDFQGAIVLIDATPNVMALAASLRDLPYRKHQSNRVLTSPDSIMLATAVHMADAYQTPIDEFHTFDKGRKPDADGNRTVPMLGFEEWCDGFTDEHLVVAQPVIDLTRRMPVHPAPQLGLANAPVQAEEQPQAGP